MAVRSACLLLALALAMPAAAEIYKWTDAEGRTHFSDSNAGNRQAETVQVRVNSYKSVSYSKLLRPLPASTAGVVLYGTRWCGYCKQAKAYMQQKGIAYTEYDIEQDASAKQAFAALGGGGVPVILIGNLRMNGFNEAGFERLLAQSRR
ncbi:MAG TPA: glutaredoxin family protein [Moraxellaceae bacterium]